MKRILSILFAAVLVLLCCACGAQETVTEAPAETECTPALYQATSVNGGVLYLFGSIHAADRRAKRLPDYVTSAYEASDYLCVECDIYAFQKDTAAQTEMVTQFLCEPGKEAADYLGQTLYEEAKAYLTASGAYMSVYDQYRPAMWLSLVENAAISAADLDADRGIDLALLKKAHREEKEIREVESVEAQYELLLSFPDTLNCRMIAEQVNHPDEAAEGLKALYEAWLSGDVEAMTALLYAEEDGATDWTAQERSLYDAYEDAMITQRNLAMADCAEDYLREGGTGFFVVGAAISWEKARWWSC